MSANKYSGLLLIYFTILAQSLSSQIIVQGTVMDNGGEYLGNGAEPVIGALVTITDQTDANRSFSANTDEQGHYTIEISTAGIEEDRSAHPGGFRLYQNYPNPFNPSTIIRYELTQPCHIQIDVYNVSGQKIKTLLNDHQNGSGQVIWDATNDIGKGVPAGLYIYSMKAEGKRINRKMLLIDGQCGNMATEISFSRSEVHTDKSVLYKQTSNIYLLEVTGENIAPYEQQNLEITGDMTVDVIVKRTVIDIEGNVYGTVKIGNQVWMTENLKVTHYRNGDVIPNVTADSEWSRLYTGAYCAHNNNEGNADIYGYLYNWCAVNDSGNIALDGWHVPTEVEWQTLADYLGGDSVAGGKLKETGYTHWNSPNTGATNASGFTALPGGFRYCSDGSFHALGDCAAFWSSSESSSSNARYRVRVLYSIDSGVYWSDDEKEQGFSVRLVRD